MPLAPGDRLGPCEILAPLGAGGKANKAYPTRAGEALADQPRKR